jgi:hypothetical protein
MRTTTILSWIIGALVAASAPGFGQNPPGTAGGSEAARGSDPNPTRGGGMGGGFGIDLGGLLGGQEPPRRREPIQITDSLTQKHNHSRATGEPFRSRQQQIAALRQRVADAPNIPGISSQQLRQLNEALNQVDEANRNYLEQAPQMTARQFSAADAFTGGALGQIDLATDPRIPNPMDRANAAQRSSALAKEGLEHSRGVSLKPRTVTVVVRASSNKQDPKPLIVHYLPWALFDNPQILPEETLRHLVITMVFPSPTTPSTWHVDAGPQYKVWVAPEVPLEKMINLVRNRAIKITRPADTRYEHVEPVVFNEADQVIVRP